MKTAQYANKMLKRIAVLAGIGKVLTFHTSRHSCAMFALNDCGISLDLTAEISGHKNSKTTQIYAKMLPETVSERLKAQMKAL
jgi:integrase